MALHRSLCRHACSARSAARLRARSISRSLFTRADVANPADSKPQQATSNSKLLEALANEPVPPVSSKNSPSNSNTPFTSAIRQRSRSRMDVLGQMAQRMPGNSNSSGSIGPSAAEVTMSRAAQAQKSRAIELMHQRQWRAGDVYSPHDLSPEEARKYTKARSPKADVFDILNINPIDEYKNLPLMLDFVTALGRLKHQKETGLRPVNQRKISKAVRRASALGLLPRTHAHPEMLRRPGPWQRKA